MWADIYNENFVDTLLLLAIPGIMIFGTIVVVLVNSLMKRRHQKRERAARLKRSESEAVERAMEAADHEVDVANRVRFGIQQSEVQVDGKKKSKK